MTKKRNANGRSSIYLGKDGYWHGRVTVGVLDNGKPDRRHVKRKTRAAVANRVSELEKEREEGTVTNPGKPMTVEQWVDHWLNDIASITTTGNGWDAYFYAVKHVRTHVGAHKLTNLRPHHLETMYRKMQQAKSSPSTAHQVHRTMRTALNEAVKRGYLSKNPAQIAKAPRLEEDEVEPFSRKEITKLFTVALKQRNACRWLIAISLGLRQGEVLGLRWQDIDFDENTLRVRLQRPRPKWAHGCGGSCGRKHAGHCPQRVNRRPDTMPPKSTAGRRPIGLPDALVEHLKQHQKRQSEEREQAGILWAVGDWVFTTETGHPINHRTDQKHWKQLLADAEVRDARLHDARHTAATALVELGVSDPAAMKVMGWSSPAVAKRYQHVGGRVLGDIADRLDAHLWESSQNPE